MLSVKIITGLSLDIPRIALESWQPRKMLTTEIITSCVVNTEYYIHKNLIILLMEQELQCNLFVSIGRSTHSSA